MDDACSRREFASKRVESRNAASHPTSSEGVKGVLQGTIAIDERHRSGQRAVLSLRSLVKGKARRTR